MNEWLPWGIIYAAGGNMKGAEYGFQDLLKWSNYGVACIYWFGAG